MSTTQHLPDHVAETALLGLQRPMNPHSQRILAASLRPVKLKPEEGGPKAKAKAKAKGKAKAAAKSKAAPNPKATPSPKGKAAAKPKAKAKSQLSPKQAEKRGEAKDTWMTAKNEFQKRTRWRTLRRREPFPSLSQTPEGLFQKTTRQVSFPKGCASRSRTEELKMCGFLLVTP